MKEENNFFALIVLAPIIVYVAIVLFLFIQAGVDLIISHTTVAKEWGACMKQHYTLEIAKTASTSQPYQEALMICGDNPYLQIL